MCSLRGLFAAGGKKFPSSPRACKKEGFSYCPTSGTYGILKLQKFLVAERGIVMKKAVFLPVFLILLAFFSSCQNGEVPSSSVLDSCDQEEFLSTYQLNRPLMEGQDLLAVEPLSLPDEINHRKTAVSSLLEETRLLLLLYQEDPLPVIEEVGIYDYTSQQYTPCFRVDEDVSLSVECVADHLMVYKETDLSTGAVSLNCYHFETGEKRKIYDFFPGYSTASVSSNSIRIYNSKVYFDDIVTRDNQVVGVNLMEWDTETQEVSIYISNGQNPLLLDSGLAYLVKDEATGSYYVESPQQGDPIFLDKGISSLASAGDGLYSICNRSRHPETGLTIWSLDRLMPEEELLLASNAIDQLAADKYVVTWRNFTPEKPLLYLREQDCFALLLEEETAYNSYLLGEEGGILICSHDNAPTTYYRFTYPSQIGDGASSFRGPGKHP